MDPLKESLKKIDEAIKKIENTMPKIPDELKNLYNKTINDIPSEKDIKKNLTYLNNIIEDMNTLDEQLCDTINYPIISYAQEYNSNLPRQKLNLDAIRCTVDKETNKSSKKYDKNVEFYQKFLELINTTKKQRSSFNSNKCGEALKESCEKLIEYNNEYAKSNEEIEKLANAFIKLCKELKFADQPIFKQPPNKFNASHKEIIKNSFLTINNNLKKSTEAKQNAFNKELENSYVYDTNCATYYKYERAWLVMDDNGKTTEYSKNKTKLVCTNLLNQWTVDPKRTNPPELCSEIIKNNKIDSQYEHKGTKPNWEIVKKYGTKAVPVPDCLKFADTDDMIKYLKECQKYGKWLTEDNYKEIKFREGTQNQKFLVINNTK